MVMGLWERLCKWLLAANTYCRHESQRHRGWSQEAISFGPEKGRWLIQNRAELKKFHFFIVRTCRSKPQYAENIDITATYEHDIFDSCVYLFVCMY